MVRRRAKLKHASSLTLALSPAKLFFSPNYWA